MTLLFSILERSPVSPLQQKLNQLTLTTMSRNLDQFLSDTANQNLSFSAALESLVDRELESRHARSIERRFRLAHLGARYSIDAFHFNHHKSRAQMKNRVLRLM